MSRYKKTVGYLGEDKVASYLEEQGYTIQARNYTIVGGEIDIIALKNNTLFFVEVKTRHQSQSYGQVWESISSKKIQKILSTAEAYVYKEAWEGDVDFLVITAVFTKNKWDFTTYPLL